MRQPKTARHRSGTVRVAVQRHSYDAEQRAAAARLDQHESRWVIWYGPWSRRFYAASAWSSTALIVDAPSVGDLVEQMRDAERDTACLAPPMYPISDASMTGAARV